MANLSDYLEAELIKHVFRTGTFTKPSTIYIALCTTAPTDASTGSTIVEPSGGSYARIQVGPADGSWSAPGAGGLTDNVGVIQFATATGSWGTVTHVAVCDAVTGGNVLFHGVLASSRTINVGDSFKFNAGELDAAFA